MLLNNIQLKQVTQKFTIEINRQEIKNLKYIDIWFEKVFDIIMPTNPTLDKDIYTLSLKALYVVRKLLQVCKIPVFYLGMIESIDEFQNRYIINLKLVYIDFIPVQYYTNILNSSFEFLYLMMDNEPTSSNIDYFIAKYLKNLISPILQNNSQSKYQIELLKSAFELNIPFIHLGNGIYQLWWGCYSKKVHKSTTGMDSAIGAKLSSNKITTTNLLKMAALPAPKNGAVGNINEAISLAKTLGYRVVVKPIDLGRGEGVSVNIEDEKKLKEAFDIAYKLSPSKKVIVEKQAKGVCHRVFIAHGKFLYAVKRLPIGIYGDGVTTISKLIDKSNQKEKEKFFWEQKDRYFKDVLAIQQLEKNGLSLESIPPKDTFVTLREIETTQWGGIETVK